jgi:hypothetical protein
MMHESGTLKQAIRAEQGFNHKDTKNTKKSNNLCVLCVFVVKSLRKQKLIENELSYEKEICHCNSCRICDDLFCRGE